MAPSNKDKKNMFLGMGGTLIRKRTTTYGEHVIIARTRKKDWHRMPGCPRFENESQRNFYFTKLLMQNNIQAD